MNAHKLYCYCLCLNLLPVACNGDGPTPPVNPGIGGTGTTAASGGASTAVASGGASTTTSGATGGTATSSSGGSTAVGGTTSTSTSVTYALPPPSECSNQ